MKKQVTLYMTIGIPGAGKSTWIENNREESLICIALDEIRRQVYGYFPQELDDQKENEIWDIALDRAAEGIRRGTNVLIDSMALTKEFRKRIISSLEEKTKVTFLKVAIFLDTPLDIAIQRSNLRSKRVSEKTILELYSFLEPPEKKDEFDEVIRVVAKK